MGTRKATSQWEFGELFPAESTRRVFSVTELTGKIRKALEQQVGEVWVAGEVTNLRVQSSGHIYFAIKDPNAQLSCVLFRGTSAADRSALKDGQRVVVQGEIGVYEPRGQYQLIVRSLEVQGVGALQAAFERLKQKLNAEGLFDPARKRAIPVYPCRLGIVTSPTGAALRDVLHVLRRRYAGIDLLLAPSRVQGQGAEAEVAAALARLNAWSNRHPEERLDVILVTRGGGSLEDLWVFNEETLARAIAASAIPVVSAVGHEIDFTIADFVADFRAATPSAAAELLTASYVEARDRILRHRQWLPRAVRQRWRFEIERLNGLGGRMRRAHPRRRLDERSQRLDDLALALQGRGHALLLRQQDRLTKGELRFHSVRLGPRIAEKRRSLEGADDRLSRNVEEGFRVRRERVERLALRLKLLAPDRILARGYSVTTDAATGCILRSSVEVVEGQVLHTRLHSGEVTSVVAGGSSGPAKAPGSATQT